MLIYLHNAAETDDLACWIMDHPAGLLTAIAIQGWLEALCDDPQWPKTVEIPEQHEKAVQYVIDDWSEVCAAQHEEFHSYVIKATP